MVSEVSSSGGKVICDTFGNYFFQLLFLKAGGAERWKLLEAVLAGDGGKGLRAVSVHKTGTFAFQNIVDAMAGDEALGELVLAALERESGESGGKSEKSIESGGENEKNEKSEKGCKGWERGVSDGPVKESVSLFTSQPVDPPTSQAMNPPTSQPVDPPTSQAMNPPTSQAMNPPTSQAMNPPTSQAMSQSMNQSIDLSTTQLSNQSINQSTSQTIDQSTTQLINQTIDQPINQISDQPTTQPSTNTPQFTPQPPNPLLSLLCHPRGTHVLQRLMKTFPP